MAGCVFQPRTNTLIFLALHPGLVLCPSLTLSSVPTTLGNFWRRRGMRGSFMLIRLKRPHKRLGGFLAAAGS